MLPILYKSLVRPFLEYGNPVWGPFTSRTRKIVESIQRRATRLVPGIRHLTYADHLSILNIPSLLYQRKRGNMITLYQIFHGLVDLELSDFFSLSSYSSTRGHSRMLDPPAVLANSCDQ